MRKLFVCLILLGMIIPFGCKKSSERSINTGLTGADELMIKNAERQFENDNQSANLDTTSLDPRFKVLKHPDWSRSIVQIVNDKKVVVVPITYQSNFSIFTGLDRERLYQINDMAKLVFYVDSSQTYHEEVVTSFPDSNYLRPGSRSFSGIIKIETWRGSLLRSYLFSGNKILQLANGSKYGGARQNGSGSVIAESIKPSTEALTVCYTANFYNYPIDNPDDGYYYSEDLGCSTYILGGEGIGSGLGGSSYGKVASGGSGSAAVAPKNTINNNSILENAGKHLIANVPDYIKCFHSSSTSSFSVSVMVDEPIPGSDATFSSTRDDGSSGLNVGHAYLVFYQNDNGMIIRRAMGLYPSGPVTPITPSSKGSLNDDETHQYNISVTIPVSGQSFQNILNTFSNGDNVTYNLNTNNCSTWALSALSAGGINLAAPKGVWPFGGGDDPGDLGEYIRTMELPLLWSRNTTGGPSVMNVGTCN